MRCLLIISVLAALLCGASGTLLQSTGANPRKERTNQTALDVRLNSLIDLHYLVRKLASGSGNTPNIDGFKPAVEAARELQSDLGSALAWGVVEVPLAECQSAREAVGAFAELPETFKFGERTIQLRQRAVRLAESLVPIEAPFLKSIWPQHRAALQRVAAKIAAGFAPKESECLAYMMKHLGMEDPQQQVPVYLVAEAPFPQGEMGDRPSTESQPSGIDSSRPSLSLSFRGFEVLERPDPTPPN